jgi:hypothetical protein
MRPSVVANSTLATHQPLRRGFERYGLLTTLDETQQLLSEKYRHLEPNRHSLHQDANW